MRLQFLVAGALAAYLILGALLGSSLPSLRAYDAARLMQLPLLLLCSLALVGAGSTRVARPGALSWLLLVLLAISASLAAAPLMAWRELALLGGLLGLSLWLRQLPGSWYGRLPSLTAAALGVHAFLVLTFTVAELVQGQVPNAYLLIVGYDNPRAYNHVQTVALPLAAIGLVTGDRRQRLLAGVAMLLSASLLFSTGARGTALGLAAAMAALLLLRQPMARRLALRFGVVLVAGALLFVLLYSGLPAWLGIADVGLQPYEAARLASGQSRGVLWQRAIELAASSPWFGVGPMHFAHGFNEKAAHPHSLYLQLAAEWGWPATLLGLGLLFVQLAKLLNRVRRPTSDSAVGLGLLAAWIALMVDSLVSGGWVMPYSQVWIALLIGWSLAWMDQTGAHTPAASARWPAWIVLMSQVGLLCLVAPELRDLPRHLAAMEVRFPSDRLHPRFWSHGHF